jgi:CHAD domain-containing protein
MDANLLTCAYGASVLLKHLAALRQEVEGVHLAEDIEAIHRMRVASRRLRAAIPLFADCLGKKKAAAWLRQIKRITQALGAARDTDVQLDLLRKVTAGVDQKRFQPGLRRLILRVSQRRQGLQAAVQKALSKLDQAHFFTLLETDLLPLQPELPAGTPLPYRLFEQSAAAIQARLKAFLAYEPYVPHPECAAELHAMRIAAKQLRYTLETFSALYPDGLAPYLQAVKSSQELLGNLHDCDVWLVYLPQFIQEERERTVKYYGHANPLHPLLPGFQYFLENRQQDRDQQYQDFRQHWEICNAGSLWNQLSEAIQAPVYQNIYPAAPDRTSISD